MKARFFTIEEANELLPTVEPLMGELLERRAKVVGMSDEIPHLSEDVHSDFGGPVASSLVLEFMAIESLVAEIQSYGCIIKDVNAGLLDFLAKKDGREVFLCWRYGEPRVEYYHDLHTGFKGRELF